MLAHPVGSASAQTRTSASPLHPSCGWVLTHPPKFQLKWHFLYKLLISLNTLSITIFTVLILYDNDLLVWLFLLEYGLPKDRVNALLLFFLFFWQDILRHAPSWFWYVGLGRLLNDYPVVFCSWKISPCCTNILEFLGEGGKSLVLGKAWSSGLGIPISKKVKSRANRTLHYFTLLTWTTVSFPVMHKSGFPEKLLPFWKNLSLSRCKFITIFL